MAKTRTPWGLIIKLYWKRMIVVSTIWFIYDYSSYAFGTYSAPNIDNVLGADAALWKTFGWNTVLNLVRRMSNNLASSPTNLLRSSTSPARLLAVSSPIG